MSARFQLRIQRYGWDKASDCYEDLWGRQVEPARGALLEMAGLQAGERVLDMACGPGPIALAAAARVGSTGFVLGADISDRMVERAGAAARREGVTNVAFVRADAETEVAAPGAFDVALCSLGLMYAPNPRVALRRLRDAVRPGGRAAVAVWGARKQCGWAEIFPIVDARVESAVCPMFFQLGTGDALEHELARAGFGNIKTQRLNVELWYESAEQAVGAAFAGGPVALAYARFDEAVRRSAEAEYLGSIERYRRGSGYALPGEFVVAAAERVG
ncbi:MAG: methyltransferase domain-containing protein [Acidobacteria bacterium]|nr:methyltransferase domain-containing protein [Acidobacteriota bacterium]